MHASNGILFNHESPIRGETFVTRKITRARGAQSKSVCRTPSTLATSTPSATGATRATTSRACGGCCSRTSRTITCWRPVKRVRCANSSSRLSPTSAVASSGEGRAAEKASTRPGGLVQVDPRYFRPTEVDLLIGDATKARPVSAGSTSHVRCARQRHDGGRPRRRAQGSKQCRDSYSLAGKRVWVAGHRGMVGSAIMRRLPRTLHIMTADRDEVDLRRQADVNAGSSAALPHAVFVAAAKVGGIEANNTLRAEFLYDNLVIDGQSSTRPTSTASRSLCSWARPASIRGSRRSRCASTRC